ncbi:protein MpABC85 [Marchantia polymorpha subsp. ruderalis]|uniref:ABC transporter domain-containing protein n=2 Tax=Marchantia polymorpha TaxID=3197 RepID=A0A176VC73_MARPO|nr:hypothetical protein AXG93_2376s1090 [Marchantia polymorpha subsp. ruderalis]PTQ28372.1 hypothetical protein MARPO_0165s0002 [Marchantia polymorpha]BBN17972.1 hypothetical protein Mp_7g18420 [Marchantia polymorpha subsp. ruderalis]|eukprot:PTQ28372.1 hypothetical protein MARPO_0165s0002 [Marchantia polymorpha]
MSSEDPGAGDKPGSNVPTFTTQANALLRKNIIYQKRNSATNCCIVSFPIAICILLFVFQRVINNVFDKADYKCGCDEATGVCGLQFSDGSQAAYCAVEHPPGWPGFVQVPKPAYRAVVGGADVGSFGRPATILYTGRDRSIADGLANSLLLTTPSNSTDTLTQFSNLIPGSSSWLLRSNIIEAAFTEPDPIYVLRNQSCLGQSDVSISVNLLGAPFSRGTECLTTRTIYRDNSSDINSELYKGFRKGDPQGNPTQIINEYAGAYDFRNTSLNNFDVAIFYNQTMVNDTSQAPPGYARVSRPMNLAVQAFVRFAVGAQAEVPLWFVKEMPRSASQLRLDLTSLLGPLFYMWVAALLFPVIVTSVVYEKQKNLRMMMKMHGLGDNAYWAITYLYFFALSIVYFFFFVAIGSLVGLQFFRLNSYSLQAVFYFVYLNLQVALGILAATIFTNAKTATVSGYLYVFGFGLMGQFFFSSFLEDKNTGRGWILGMEFLPPFSLYRGLYEFGQYAFVGNFQKTDGMKWGNLSDKDNGLRTVLIIQAVEWLVALFLAWYLDQVVQSGSGIRKHPLFFLRSKKKLSSSSAPAKSLSRTKGVDVDIEMDKPDVAQERSVVDRLRHEPDSAYSIICDNLKKVYPGTDGNPDKYAVRGLSLAVQRNECFGMLGPNGAGKTSTINMMIGFLTPSSGTAYIKGLDIRTEMDRIYTSMGVCPQHDLIWETLSGREHLMFYGRLKNLKGSALESAVDASLKSVNLFNNGVGDKRSGQYSGGMKRRLSVAISLIGNPQVVYMDEPSTGLDPASRFNLWNVVKQAKKDRAIILTTHSMEEAEALCDRLGIFVNGQLQCIGDSKELTSRYGGVHVLTITTPADEEDDVAKMVSSFSPNARKVYGLAGTQKFEIPKTDVQIAQIFASVEKAKQSFSIQAWGIADTTLEDVFIQIAREAQGDVPLS